MRKKSIFLAISLLTSTFIKAQIIDVSVYDDCSKNGYTKVIESITGTATVLSSSGRDSCDYVQLWEGGPKWATFNVGATITDYANLTIGADSTTFWNNTDLAPYYNTANIGGLYAWKNPYLNGRKNTWTSGDSISDVATTLWGSNWSTPTIEQLDTLQNSTLGKTTWTWCDGSNTQYVKGCSLTGYKVSGKGIYAQKSIFLPVTGCFSSTIGKIDSRSAYYWSNTTTPSPKNPLCLIFSEHSSPFIITKGRLLGASIRAVLDEDAEPTKNVSVALYADGCESSNVISCPVGQQLRITAESSLDGRKFTGWSDGNTDNPRTITVTHDTTFVANFSPIIYHVEVLSADTTLGYVFGGGEATYNTEMQISAVCSQEGYHFTHWSDGSTVPGRKITVESDSTLIAYFAEDTPAECVTVDVNNPSLGSADIQIVATPASGATFTNWSDGNTDNPRIVTDAPDNYIAVFVSTATNARATKASTNDPEKIIRDNQLYILRDGKTYNAQGAEL